MSDEATAARLRALLAPHLAEGVETPAHYSVRIQHAQSQERRPLHLLYQDACPVLRARDDSVVIRCLLDYLAQSAYATDDLVLIRGVTIVDGEGTAFVAPYYLRKDSALRERWLRAHGLTLLHAPVVGLDAPRGEVVRLPPPLTLTCDTPQTVGGSDRFRLRGWIVPTDTGSFGPITPLAALEPALRMVASARSHPAAALTAIEEILPRVSLVGTGSPLNSRDLLLECVKTAAAFHGSGKR